MRLQIKSFSELTTDELYALLRLRVAVFVVEQECAYQEVDGFDKQAIHVMLLDDSAPADAPVQERILAYCRVLPAGCTFEETSLGRVIATKRHRGYGSRVLEEGIRVAREMLHAPALTIEAQTYASGMYRKQGFVQTSDEFLEDGIPHIRMYLDLEPEA
ncbi:MAG: GNAT family N-acetyltransferase [Coriobacteriales bacterium]|nr:GNAT family N-acetyltransferase [Coriobacteriales bacterium]